MKNYYNGYTPQIKREIQAITERQEIEQIVNAQFEPEQKKLFNILLLCCCCALIIIPSVLLSL